MADEQTLPEVKPDDTEQDDKETPETPEAEPAAEPAPEPAPVEAPNETPAPAPEAATTPTVAPAPMPTPTQPLIPQPAPMKLNDSAILGPPVASTQDLNKEDMLYASDSAQGHIEPKTVQELYAKQDTIGKIGTLFGLMLGGAGAGLTHQPNAVLEMMNKEIERDLEAQKTSATNRQNFLNLSREHEQQKIAATTAHYENLLTEATTANKPAEAAQIRAHIKLMKSQAQEAAENAAKTKMQIGSYQGLENAGKKIPPGPTKDLYDQNLSQVGAGIVQDSQARNTLQPQKQMAQWAVLGPLPAPAGGLASKKEEIPIEPDNGQLPPSAVDSQAFDMAQRRGVAAERLGMAPQKGQLLPSDVGRARDEVTAVDANRQLAKQYNHAFTVLHQAWLNGKLNPEMYNAETATLIPELARQTAGRFSAGEASSQSGGLFPSMYDFGKSDVEKYKNTMRYFEGNDHKLAPTLNSTGLKTAYPKFADPFVKPKNPNEGLSERITASGKTALFDKDNKFQKYLERK